MQVTKYDNKFSSRETIIISLVILIINILSILLDYICDKYWLYQSFEINWYVKAEQMFIIMSFAAIVLFSLARCKYRIIDDVLHVQEKILWYVLIDTTIPLSTIDEVRLTRTFNHPRKHIQLRTDDAVYDLSCTTYRDELYDALNRRIIENQSRPTKSYFYKQKS